VIDQESEIGVEDKPEIQATEEVSRSWINPSNTMLMMGSGSFASEEALGGSNLSDSLIHVNL
jgi:hypothetical protein